MKFLHVQLSGPTTVCVVKRLPQFNFDFRSLLFFVFVFPFIFKRMVRVPESSAASMPSVYMPLIARENVCVTMNMKAMDRHVLVRKFV